MNIEALREKWESQPIPYLSEDEVSALFDAAIEAERMWRTERERAQTLLTRLELTECRHCPFWKRLFCGGPCAAEAMRQEEA